MIGVSVTQNIAWDSVENKPANSVLCTKSRHQCSAMPPRVNDLYPSFSINFVFHHEA